MHLHYADATLHVYTTSEQTNSWLDNLSGGHLMWNTLKHMWHKTCTGSAHVVDLHVVTSSSTHNTSHMYVYITVLGRALHLLNTIDFIKSVCHEVVMNIIN